MTTIARQLAGRSVQGRPIRLYRAPAGPQKAVRRFDALVLGGIHGDEPKSVYVLERLLAELASADALAGLPAAAAWGVVPLVNPDGYERRRRRNARGVDLNRNFPTRDWSPGRPHRRYYGGPRPLSEPESRAIARLIARYRPARVLSVHSISDHQYCNNYDGPAGAWARRLGRCNGYPVTPSIGYPTPGSFGTWLGIEERVPVITLELPSHHSRERCYRDNRRALRTFLALPADCARFDTEGV